MRRDHQRRSLLGLWRTAAILAVLAAAPFSWAQEEEFSDFEDLDINNLLNMQVVSSTKVAQSIMDSPNAIWVIKAEDIKRSGYRTIPESLRLAPGVFVARMSANSWVVTMEGFAHGQYTNNILVMIDGVSVYSVTDGGVAWEDLPVALDEIERIEVVRGPGGVLYGANAVNGVINIITWRASADSPDYVIAKGGTQGTKSGSAATTFQSDDGGAAVRVFINYDEDEGLGMLNGIDDFGRQDSFMGSAETNVKLSGTTNFLFAANYKRATLNYDRLISEPNVARREEQTLFRARLEQEANGGSWYLQAFSRHLIREGMRGANWGPHEEDLVQDLEFQHMVPFEAAGKHKFIYGGGYRWIAVTPPPTFRDAEEDFSIANAYVHDEWAFNEQLKLNAGVKWEEASLSGPTWQWRGAMIYQPRPEHSFRVSASNAFRSPHLAELSYYEEIASLPEMPPILPPPGWEGPWAIAIVTGAQELDPEEVRSYEFGYRGVFDNKVVVDLTYAYREYDDLIALIKTNPGTFIPALGITENAGQYYSWRNQGKAVSNSIEAGLDARLTEEWRVLANYSYIDLRTNEKSVENRDTNIPRNMGRVQLSYSSPSGFMADASAAYTDRLKVVFVSDPRIVHEIRDYCRLDARVAQRFSSKSADVTVGVVGENLGQDWHEEYANFAHEEDPHQVRKAFYGFIEIAEPEGR